MNETPNTERMPNILRLTFNAVMMFLSTSKRAISKFMSNKEYH